MIPTFSSNYLNKTYFYFHHQLIGGEGKILLRYKYRTLDEEGRFLWDNLHSCIFIYLSIYLTMEDV